MERVHDGPFAKPGEVVIEYRLDIVDEFLILVIENRHFI
jgi:hypothetical protein